MRYILHRFLISGPDMGIDANFSPFTPSCVHRFLISSPDLGIDARFFPFTLSCVHRFLISSPDLRIAAGFRLQRLLQQRTFASNSNFRCVKEEWPACYGRSGIDPPRPILIFVASKKNGPPAAAVAATLSAADSNFCCCKEEWPA